MAAQRHCGLWCISFLFVLALAHIHAYSAEPDPSTAEQRFPHDKLRPLGSASQHDDFRLRHEHAMYRRDMREYLPGGDPYLRPDYLKGDYMFQQFPDGRQGSTTKGTSGDHEMYLSRTRDYHRQIYEGQHGPENMPSHRNFGTLQAQELHGRPYMYNDAARLNAHEATRGRSRESLGEHPGLSSYSEGASSTRQSAQVRMR
jgi:hypothetical protein